MRLGFGLQGPQVRARKGFEHKQSNRCARLDRRQEKAGATSIGAQARQQRLSNENKV
jgi:hypothetical protein